MPGIGTVRASPGKGERGRERPRRVALVHDFLVDLRGAERTFEAMCDLWPEADLFTAVYDERGTEGRFAGRRLHASFLQRARPTARSFRALLPLYPIAMEALDLGGYDLVVSSSSAWAHGVTTDERAVHVCYCHNPFRYAWNERDTTLARAGAAGRQVLAPVLDRWQHWDRRVARRVSRYVANSQTTRQRIADCFGRDADVVHPPVRVDRFAPRPTAEHFVLVSELMAHKRIDVAVRAFNARGLPLVIVGDGPEARRLERIAGPTVRLEGRVSDDRLRELVCTSRGLVVTAVEEFGMAAVEAQAAGRPVLAPDRGGGLETVVEGETGRFYAAADVAALTAALAAFELADYDPAACIANAERFSVVRFGRELTSVVADAWERRESGPAHDERALPGVLRRLAVTDAPHVA